MSRRLNRPNDERDQVVNAQLENWGMWARGLPDYLGHPKEPSSDSLPDPIEDEAQRVEKIMVDCKARRPQLFKLAKLRYIHRLPMVIVAQEMKMSEQSYRENTGKLYGYVGAKLEQ